jgi:hypothetical protein
LGAPGHYTGREEEEKEEEEEEKRQNRFSVWDDDVE